MKRLLAFVTLALASCSSPVEAPQGYSSAAPPIWYSGPATATVSFQEPAQVDQGCRQGMPPLPANVVVRACAYPGTARIVMPDPCPLAATEYYARLMCHEKAHLLGWQHD